MPGKVLSMRMLRVSMMMIHESVEEVEDNEGTVLEIGQASTEA